ADIEGDDIGVTLRVGFLYELDDRTQFGLSAQTGTELELKGDAEISGVPGQGTLTEKVEVPLAIPEAITVGARHLLTDDITLLAGATYARWGRFEELDIVCRLVLEKIKGAAQEGAILSHVTEQWKNPWQFN